MSPTDTGTHRKAFFYPGVPGCGDKMVMPHVWSMLGPVSIPAPRGQGPPSQLITSLNTDGSSEGHGQYSRTIAESSLLREKKMTRTAKPSKSD